MGVKQLLKFGLFVLIGCTTYISGAVEGKKAVVLAMPTLPLPSSPLVPPPPPPPIMDEDGRLFRTALDELDVACVISVIKLHVFERTRKHNAAYMFNRWVDKYPWMVEELKTRIVSADTEYEIYGVIESEEELLNKTECNAKLWYTLYIGKGEEA